MTELRLCMQCNINEPLRGYDPNLGYPFIGCYFFCSKECREQWIENHPNDDTFIDKGENKKVETFCPKCNHKLKEFILDGVSTFKCTYRKCKGDKNEN